VIKKLLIKTLLYQNKNKKYKRQAASDKPQATSGKPTPSGGGEKAFYKIVLDIRSGIL
jgi:hypothetical protein